MKAISRGILIVAAFFCLFCVLVQVFDRGGGRSGRPRLQVTAWDRIGEGIVWGTVGVACLIGVISSSRGRPKPATGPADREV